MDILPIPHPHSLTIFCSSSAAGEPVINLIAALALRGPLAILDGGNCFPAYRLLRTVRGQMIQPDLGVAQDFTSLMQRITIRRAFTCHQMLSLLECTLALPQPYILLNPLSTFYDEQIQEHEVRRLLDASLRQVERLVQSAPVLITVLPPHNLERAFLVEQICTRANQLLISEFPGASVFQPALF